MKKKVLLSFLIVYLMFNLIGCSTKKACSVRDGAIVFGDEVSSLTEWRGDGASHDFNGGLTIRYYICDSGPADCSHNTAGVLEENMTKFKKAKYYSLYLQTYFYMYYPMGDKWIEGEAIIEDTSSYAPSQVVEMMYKDMNIMLLSEDVLSVTYEDKVTLDTSSWDFKARPSELVIPSLLRIKVDDGSVTMQSTIQMDGVTLGKASTEKFDYYKYDNILIQAAIGTDISGLVSFKK